MATYKIIGGDGKEYGPVSQDEMRQWIAEGRLSGPSRVLVEGEPQWRQLAGLAEFKGALDEQARVYGRDQAEAEPIEPMYPGGVGSEVEVRLDVVRCFARSSRLLASNFGLLFGGTLAVWAISLILQLLPMMVVLYWLLKGVLYGGLYLLFLGCIRGRGVGASEVFHGFRAGPTQLMLAGVITSLLSAIGFVFCVLPWVYLTVAWAFAVPLVADRRMEFWPAMELSRRVVTRCWPQVCLLLVVAFLPVILMHVATEIRVMTAMLGAMKETFGTTSPPLGEAIKELPRLMETVGRSSMNYVWLTQLVLLLNLPFAVGAMMYAYEELFGEGKNRGA